MSKDRKRMIVDVLTQFYQSNLASHDAREWIAEEIVKKLDNEKHEVSTQSPTFKTKPMEKGLFEEYLSNIEEQNAKIAKQVQEELDKKQKEIISREESKEVKVEPKKQTKKSIPPVDGKKVKKTKPTKSFKNIDKTGSKFI